MTFPFFTRITKRSKGFTLVETMVSAAIITFAVLGPLTVASNASTHARMTKDTLIATYLAQEAIELLRLQQDSVYIQCSQDASLCPVVGNETPDQAAWRIFRGRIGNTVGGPSCYSTESVVGCSYDFVDMTTNLSAVPSKYASSDVACDTLSLETSTGLYLCSGAHGAGAGFTRTNFSRSVSITPIVTIPGADQFYHEDLRVTVTVTFRRANGFTRTIRVVDFVHARA